MAITPPKKGDQQGRDLYTSRMNLDESTEKKFDHALFNLNVELIDAINDYIAQEKRENVKMWDEKTQKEKSINKSLWAREVFKKALQEVNYKPTPKRGE
ncbi:hypothetical protein [Priestia megaterium]|uniref:hypothetical protein n=1 Tax=Priestia megaterium TaxID=1404 RepID=UPI002E25147B|nr:hypothetical protein [Priestia megaterium]